MSHESTLKAAGAQCVGGDFLLKGQVVGQHRHGELVLTLAGIALIEDLENAKQDEILVVVKDTSRAQAQQQQTSRRGRKSDPKDPEVGDLS